MALTPQQTQLLQTTIEKRRQALLAELHEDWQRVRRDQEELFGNVPDPGDASVAALIADLDKADLGRDLSELRAVEAARERLREGTYGVCIDCGRDIGVERLKANPVALRCINDQTLYETTHGRGSGPSL
jgi:DnaK suppressor protein